MDRPSDNVPHLVDASKRVAQQALVICENRIQLLLLEAQEERERILYAFWLSLGVAIFGLLAGVSLTVVITLACWQWSPLAALLILTALYGGGAVYLNAQLARLRRDWHSFSSTFDELRKDRECLERNLN